MIAPFLTYDPTFLFQTHPKNSGLGLRDVKFLRSRLLQAAVAIDTLRKNGEQGWEDLPFQEKDAQKITARAKDLQRSFTNLLVIGIGGSALGTKALSQALGRGRGGMSLSVLDNPDPQTVWTWAHQPKSAWKRTLVHVVSKSGKTLEPLVNFLALQPWMVRALGKKGYQRHVVVTTETDTRSPLYALAKKERFELLPHPANVDGRFSVLSVVSLFPAACAGIDVLGLLRGGRWIEETYRSEGPDHMAAQFAALHYLSSTKFGRNIHVLMPYVPVLSGFASWYRQLWAESLGKRKDGKNVGPTPVASLGPADQHSQIQLYHEGPDNKLVTFLGVEKFSKAVPIAKNAGALIPEMKKASGMDLGEILRMEHLGTAQALFDDRRPNGTLIIPNLSPESLGALFQFFELATALIAQLFGVNAYDQPGVEAGKKEIRKMLSERT
ncbi:MAG TPA: glucose-6-phosphate isomerase [Patescibacteria group bacterium]|nr:glucose-6-phosphate isomerase [Patescibacteria group bacterium]